MKRTFAIFVIPLLFGLLHAQDRSITQEDLAAYIPKDLDDAVQQLKKLISESEKERIRKGETKGEYGHFGLGWNLRHSWGQNKNGTPSRLAKYFFSNGLYHSDDLSGYILDAFHHELEGKKYDLLSMVRNNAKEWPRYFDPVILDGDEVKIRNQAVLYRRFDYDDENRIVSTSLLWNTDSKQTYFVKGDTRGLATEEELDELRKDGENWMFADEEQRILRDLFAVDPEERRKRITAMNDTQVQKFGWIVSEVMSPERIGELERRSLGELEAEQDSAR